MMELSIKKVLDLLCSSLLAILLFLLCPVVNFLFWYLLPFSLLLSTVLSLLSYIAIYCIVSEKGKALSAIVGNGKERNWSRAFLFQNHSGHYLIAREEKVQLSCLINYKSLPGGPGASSAGQHCLSSEGRALQAPGHRQVQGWVLARGRGF